MTESIVESSTETVLNVAKAEAIRVLHVDDDQICLKVGKQCLETQDEFEVDTASSIDEALEKLKKTDYDVIVSDYQMPGKDGLEFLKELREQGNTVPFIVFTGKGREEIAMRAINLGASGYFNKQGQPETVYGELAHGIRQAKERKKAETTIWEREERLRAVFSSSPDAIAVSDLHGNILDCNETAWKMLGFSSRKELIGRNSIDFIAQKDRQKACETLKKTPEQGTTRNLEYTLLNKDGEESWAELSISILKDSSGNPSGLVSIMRDITERKKAEQTLKESEERSRSIVETSSDQIFMLDRDCRFLSVNTTGADLFRMSPQEMVGRSVSEVFPKTIAAQFSKNIKNVFDTGNSTHIDEKMVVEGRELYSSSSLNPVRDDSGRVIAVTGIVRDITERKKIEETLQESEERFRAIFEGANDGILVADIETKRFAFANPRICEITGYSSEELLKLGVGDIHPKKDLPHVIDSFTKLVQGKLTLAKDLPVLRKDERVVYCDVSARSVKIGSQEYLIGLFRDVTERKKSEQMLRASLERYRSFVEVTGELGWTTNPEGEVVEDTPSFRKFSGQTYEEIKGWGWSKALHPDDLERATQIWKEATRTKSKYETEYRMRRHDGVYRYFMARSVPMLKEDGSIREWVGTCIDITDLKDVQEHLKETNKKLEATNEKLHVVGSLSRHDVNNKLLAVTGYAYLLKKKHADQADIVEGLGMMEQAVKEVGKIFDFARMYEKLGVEELTYVDVEKTLDEAVTLFSGLTIKVVNGCHGLTVLADSFLRQLFYNFIDNTRKYGGKATAVKVYYEKAESGELRLVYEDDGVGISAENKLKLFTEGFSTGGSTGFGLFLIRKMMEVYGWQIQETGEPGKGAKFIITLPKANLNGKENYQLS